MTTRTKATIRFILGHRNKWGHLTMPASRPLEEGTRVVELAWEHGDLVVRHVPPGITLLVRDYDDGADRAAHGRLPGDGLLPELQADAEAGPVPYVLRGYTSRSRGQVL